MKAPISIVALALSAGVCFAQQADENAINRMYEHYQSLSGCSVSLGMHLKTDDPQMAPFIESMNKGSTSHAYAVKPNLFAFWQDETAGHDMPMLPMPAIYSDGETTVSLVSSVEMYVQDDAEADFGALVKDTEAGIRQGWQVVPGGNFLLALMSPDPKAALESQLVDITYEGVFGEGDKAYHAYSSADATEGTKLEMRIAATGEPWLVGFKPDLAGSGAPAGLEVVLAFSDWEKLTEAPEDGKIVVEDGWEEVDTISEAIMKSMPGGGGRANTQAEPEPASAGVQEGQPAPDFSLAILGSEGEFSLAAQRGNVVVLDFWATWCPPCVQGLPVVSKVTADLADKGVVFAAVNIMEDPKTVSTFMKNKKWDFTVALDESGSVGDTYGASAIPYTIIIDKKGVVRNVHVGFAGAEQTERDLRHELETLIAE